MFSGGRIKFPGGISNSNYGSEPVSLEINYFSMMTIKEYISLPTLITFLLFPDISQRSEFVRQVWLQWSLENRNHLKYKTRH